MKILFTFGFILTVAYIVGSKPAVKQTLTEESKQLSGLANKISAILDFINKLKNPKSPADPTRQVRDVYSSIVSSSLEASLMQKNKEDLFNLANKFSSVLNFIEKLKSKTPRKVRATLNDASLIVTNFDANDQRQLANLANKLETILDFVYKLKNQKTRVPRALVQVDFEKVPMFLNITFSEDTYRDVVKVYGYLNNLQKSGIKFV